MRCPPISEAIIFSDDAKLAAQVCCRLAKAGVYLPVCDGPRLQRPDGDAEVVRRHNAVARAKSKAIYLVGLSDGSFEALRASLVRYRHVSCRRISSLEEVVAIAPPEQKRETEPLIWGRDRIGIGLLKALRARRSLIFDDKPSPTEQIAPRNAHLVVCEEGEELAQVIAANYAFSLGAGLLLIPKVDRELAESILERFYSLYDRDSRIAPAQAQDALRQELSELCGPIPVPSNGSITFIGDLPFGFAFPEVPSTHLFKYPDLGIAVVNGFTAEQPDTNGTGIVVLVDPGTTPAPEIEGAVNLLKPRRAFIRGYEGNGANVRAISDMVEMFPYDLLIFATHCGDSAGYRWTYEFTDSEGLQRTLVVDLAIGLARTDDPEILSVLQFTRFISLDGVDWNDPREKAKLYVGTAMIDFIEKSRSGPNELKPVKREHVERVVGSSAMMMADGNYIAVPRSLADQGTPIVINNACLSWHRLAGTFIFGNARAYVGTLFPVLPFEASQVIVSVLDKHWGKPLPTAFWAAQRDVYGDGARRPYVVSGVFPQRLRIKHVDYPDLIRRRLARGLTNWKKKLDSCDPQDAERIRGTSEIIKVYRRELDHFLRQRGRRAR